MFFEIILCLILKMRLNIYLAPKPKLQQYIAQASVEFLRVIYSSYFCQLLIFHAGSGHSSCSLRLLLSKIQNLI